MKLISMNCPNCGSAIEVDSKSKKSKCEYCGTNILLDDNTITVKHMMEGSITEEQEFINAKTNLEVLKDYDAAYLGYLALSQKYVNNYELWLGLILSYTEEFTSYKSSENLEEYWNKFKALAPKEEVSKYEVSYKQHLQKVEEYKIKESKKEKRPKALVIVLDIIKYALAFFFAFAAFLELEYSIIPFLLLIMLTLLVLDGVIIKKKFITNKSIKYPLMIVLFFAGILTSSDVIPSVYYGTYTREDGSISKVKLSENKDEITINGKRYKADSSAYYKGVIYIEVEEVKYKFKINEEDNNICYLDSNDKCSYTLTKDDK